MAREGWISTVRPTLVVCFGLGDRMEPKGQSWPIFARIGGVLIAQRPQVVSEGVKTLTKREPTSSRAAGHQRFSSIYLSLVTGHT